MAVAGMNNVSVLESSYLGENCPPVSRRFGNQDLPISRTSFIRKMWRDLEGERQQTSSTTPSSIGSQCSCSSEKDESEDASITTSEVENECPRDQNQMDLQNGQEDNINSCSQRSPALCLADKQRVRQIFREWGSKNSHNHSHGHGHGHASYKNCSRVQGGSDNECKRVRTVRQWIESNNLESETTRSIRRLYGRQALLDLLARFQIERKQEIQNLEEKRRVSNFSHRNRIQSLLKGRFLWNQRFVQEEKSTSTAVNELGLLRQTQTVSDLRKGFLSKLVRYEHYHDGPQYDTASENSDNSSDFTPESPREQSDNSVNENEIMNPVSDVSQSHKVDSETDVTETPDERNEQVMEEEGIHPLALTEFNPENQLALTEFIGTSDQIQNENENQEASLECQEPIVEDNGNEWHELTNSESNEGLDLDSNSINEDEWYQEETWYNSDDDSNNNRPELRELSRRRRVSNLLQSDFRETLDLVIQSLIERQEDQASGSDNGDWVEETEEDDVTEHVEDDDDDASPTAVTHTRQIDGLRVEMVNLQERMNSMQKTLEICVNMQIELQKSVRQEISSALNPSCFLCCDGGFDTSPDRCGHVYVCSKCVEKVDWSKVKESVRHP